MEMAVKVVRKKKARKIVVVVPVMPAERVSYFKGLADELIYINAPHYFMAVGQFYEAFPQVSHEEVIHILQSRKPVHHQQESKT